MPPTNTATVAAWAAVVLSSCQPTAITEQASSTARPIVRALIAPIANSGAARVCSVPPHSVAIQLKIISPIGTTSAIAKSIAKSLEAEGDRGGVHVLHPREGAEHGDRQQAEHRRAVAEQRLSSVGRKHSEITPPANTSTNR